VRRGSGCLRRRCTPWTGGRVTATTGRATPPTCASAPPRCKVSTAPCAALCRLLPAGLHRPDAPVAFLVSQRNWNAIGTQLERSCVASHHLCDGCCEPCSVQMLTCTIARACSLQYQWHRVYHMGPHHERACVGPGSQVHPCPIHSAISLLGLIRSEENRHSIGRTYITAEVDELLITMHCEPPCSLVIASRHAPAVLRVLLNVRHHYLQVECHVGVQSPA
jgi:hypothetical protein